jgi:Protein of unknown function (DUF1553)/Protein of unknown function (DUF1549)
MRALFKHYGWAAALAGALLAPVAPAADDYPLTEKQRAHWAWQSPHRPTLPGVKDPAWVCNPVDLFVLARLEGDGVRPAPAAPREQLLRRVTFDLTGLPPTPEESDAFLNDPAPDAWEKVVDRLLASSRYGERWGRHWLDLVRYADSNGFEFDEPRPDAWRYRDYVVASFNQDKPYDRFVREQVAGDELWPDDPTVRIATGVHLLGPDMTDASDPAQRRQDTLNDMTDTTGLVFLGLTVGCARCHDHKFEPIPQADYYRLQAFFAPAVFRRDLLVATKQEQERYAVAAKEYAELVKPIQEEIAALEGPVRKQLVAARMAKLSDEAREAHATPDAQRTGGQKELVQQTARLLEVKPEEIVKGLAETDRARHKELLARLQEFDARKPVPLPVALGLQDATGPAPKTFVLERGERSAPADEVRPGFPLVLSKDYQTVDAQVEAPRPGTTGRRAALAAWLTRPDNPLVARVLVNRLWQHHFGRGLVATPSDFGMRGAASTHPELLDWLAMEFVASGWSVKHLHRLILTSAAYRQASRAPAEARAKDPDNLFFSRQNRQRLEGEAIRDSLLAVSGRLNHKMGGPGVFPPVPPEALKGSAGWKASPDPADHVRRSVYVFARRNLRFPFLEAFDLPDSNLSCPKRERSTTAPQALALLNSSDVAAAAKALGERVAREAQGEEEQVPLAYRLTLGRRPTVNEVKAARAFLAGSPLSELCRALLNVNEFVYVD